MENRVLEVIACTAADAVEAEHGGADRLEVVRRLDIGGLTPDIDIVRKIKENVKIPVRVMIREAANFTVADGDELERLCMAAREFEKIGVDGVVLGFVNDGEPDIETTRKILASAPKLKATFHHAFEETADKFAAIEKLKILPQIDRILSHGGKTTGRERCENLASYSKAARPNIEILAGGGIDAEMISLLRNKTSIREFHIGRAARNGDAVSADKVANLAALLEK
jgi:copper homeostasis protein